MNGTFREKIWNAPNNKKICQIAALGIYRMQGNDRKMFGVLPKKA